MPAATAYRMDYSRGNYALTAAQKGWGPGWPVNRSADMATVQAKRSGVKLVVHKRIARLVRLLVDVTEAHLPDGYPLHPGWCWGFASRPIRGTERYRDGVLVGGVPSNHSWGLACDFNAPNNPFTGALHTDMPAWMPALWNRYGFAWGGAYTSGNVDPMHYEFMGSPDDADKMTALAYRELAGAETTDDLETLIMALYGSKKAFEDAMRLLLKQEVENGVERGMQLIIADHTNTETSGAETAWWRDNAGLGGVFRGQGNMRIQIDGDPGVQYLVTGGFRVRITDDAEAKTFGWDKLPLHSVPADHDLAKLPRAGQTADA